MCKINKICRNRSINNYDFCTNFTDSRRMKGVKKDLPSVEKHQASREYEKN